MRKGTWSVVVLSFLLVHGKLAWTEPVPVLNPSSEAQIFNVGGFSYGLTNWNAPGNQGAFRPGTTSYPAGVSDGVNVAWSNGGTISQVLRHRLTAGLRYTLKVDVGDRLEYPLPAFIIELRAGGDSVAAKTTPAPSNGQFATVTAISLVIPANHPNLGAPLEIRLTNTGGAQVNYDNVQLDASIRRGFCNDLQATILGTLGDDVLEGTEGDDVIAGFDGNDVIYGYGGNDVICGGPGDDILLGGIGNDQILGDDGNDILHGEAGNDVLSGGVGRDALFGDAGRDTLSGGTGNDYLNGGDGDDRLTGSSGSDVCDGSTDSTADTAFSCEILIDVP